MLKNGTIAKVNLKELEFLIPKCQICLIESDSGQDIEFKLVYKETKYNPCGSDKVLMEQIMLKFNIKPAKIKQMRQ
jgi:hypothetical protein